MPKDWWKTFFDENYITLWGLEGMFKHTKKEVNFLTKIAPLKKSHSILDLCCGHGRHTLELARRGYRVVGLDYSRYELGVAEKAAEEQGLKVDFRRGDARTFRMRQKFDIVINMFTAFGYGSKDDDKKIIANVSRHLKKGGNFFIDLMSLPWLWRNYRLKKTKTYGEVKLFQERNFDFLSSVNRQRMKFKKGKHVKVYQSYNRFYSLSDLADILRSEGLLVEKYWGSYDGKNYGLDTKRMLVLAKKV